jgi:hypothetical protein
VQNALRQLDDEVVSGVMTQAVVHHLEAVHVDEEHGKFVVLVALGAREGSFQAVQEQGTIGQIGERIVKSIVHQLFLGLLQLGDVLEDGEHAGAAVDIDGLGGLQAGAPITGLGVEVDLEVANAALFGQGLHEPAALFGIGPKVQLRGGAADDLLTLETGHREEAVIHVEVALFGNAGDGDGLGIGVERLIEPVFGFSAFGQILRTFHFQPGHFDLRANKCAYGGNGGDFARGVFMRRAVLQVDYADGAPAGEDWHGQKGFEAILGKVAKGFEARGLSRHSHQARPSGDARPPSR